VRHLVSHLLYIVWDATEIVEFTRKHTARVHESLAEVRRIIEALVKRRDERRDGFVKTILKAMRTQLGQDVKEVERVLTKAGIGQSLARRAVQIAEQKGQLTLFCVIDALTRVIQETNNGGDRAEADQKIGNLLSLATS